MNGNGQDNRAPILRLAGPALLSQASFTLTGIIDLMMVGSISPQAIAAVGMGGTIFWNMVVLLGGAATATLYLCGQSWGRRDLEGYSRRALSGLFISVILGIGFAFFPAIVSRFLYTAMGAEEEVIVQGVNYFTFRLLGFPAHMAFTAMESAVKSTGNTKTPMFIKVGSHLCNIAGNYIFIFGKLGFRPLGTRGAGLSTFIADILALAGFTVLFIVTFRKNGIPLGFPFGRGGGGRNIPAPGSFTGPQPGTAPETVNAPVPVKTIGPKNDFFLVLREGMKVALQGFSSSFSILVYTSIITRIGSIPLAANQVAVSIISLSFLPAFGLGQASEILMSQFIGKGQPDRARKTGYRVLLYCCGLMILFGVCIGLFPEAIGGLYTRSGEVLALLGPMLLISAFFQILDAVQIVLAASLRATGDTAFLLWVTTLASWGIFVPLVWFLSTALGKGILWAWGCRYALMLILAVCFMIRYRRKRWSEVRPR